MRYLTDRLFLFTFKVREFLIAVYLEPFQIRPAYVWQWTVHALHRIDLVATVGQLSPPTGILLRTKDLLPPGNARPVAVYTNRPQEVIIGTEHKAGTSQITDPTDTLSFFLSPRAVYELKVSQIGNVRNVLCVYRVTNRRKMMISNLIISPLKPEVYLPSYQLSAKKCSTLANIFQQI